MKTLTDLRVKFANSLNNAFPTFLYYNNTLL